MDNDRFCYDRVLHHGYIFFDLFDYIRNDYYFYQDLIYNNNNVIDSYHQIDYTYYNISHFEVPLVYNLLVKNRKEHNLDVYDNVDCTNVIRRSFSRLYNEIYIGI